MKRYDLRNHKDKFLPVMVKIMKEEIEEGEVAIFMFEIGNFSGVQDSADSVKRNKWILMNSLKYNEVDWTIVVKKGEKPLIQESTTNV